MLPPNTRLPPSEMLLTQALRTVNQDAVAARQQGTPLHILYRDRHAAWRAQLLAKVDTLMSDSVRSTQSNRHSSDTTEFSSTRQDDFLAHLAGNPALAVELARRADGMVVLNADDFVGLSPSMRGAAVDEGPNVYAAVKASADAVRRAAFGHQMATSRGTILFTAGGPGSGKSTLAQFLTTPAWIYDSVLPDLAIGEDLVRRALEHQFSVQILLLVRSPGEAMRANLNRAFHEKRLASARKLARSHVRARATVQSLARTYAGDPRVSVQAVSIPVGSDAHPITLSDVPPLDLAAATAETLAALERIEFGNDPEWMHGPLPPRIRAAAHGAISCD